MPCMLLRIRPRRHDRLLISLSPLPTLWSLATICLPRYRSLHWWYSLPFQPLAPCRRWRPSYRLCLLFVCLPLNPNIPLVFEFLSSRPLTSIHFFPSLSSLPSRLFFAVALRFTLLYLVQLSLLGSSRPSSSPLLFLSPTTRGTVSDTFSGTLVTVRMTLRVLFII